MLHEAAGAGSGRCGLAFRVRPGSPYLVSSLEGHAPQLVGVVVLHLADHLVDHLRYDVFGYLAKPVDYFASRGAGVVRLAYVVLCCLSARCAARLTVSRLRWWRLCRYCQRRLFRLDAFDRQSQLQRVADLQELLVGRRPAPEDALESLLKCVWVAAAPVLCLHSRGTASRSTRRASGSHRRDPRSPAACC